MSHKNEVLVGYKYVANFSDQPLRVGSIFRMDDRESILALDLTADYPDLGIASRTSTGSQGSLKFSAQRDVSITFGGSVTGAPGESAVMLKFKRAKSVAGAFNEVYVDALRYDPLLDRLKAIWTDRGFMKYRREYFLVFEALTAASGTLIYSMEKSNEVVLQHTLGTPVTKVADLGSGKFEYVSNTRQTLEIIRTTAHRPLFRAFRFRSSWKPEILG